MKTPVEMQLEIKLVMTKGRRRGGRQWRGHRGEEAEDTVGSGREAAFIID